MQDWLLSHVELILLHWLGNPSSAACAHQLVHQLLLGLDIVLGQELDTIVGLPADGLHGHAPQAAPGVHVIVVRAKPDEPVSK